ncbi:hypothetical protein H8S23_05100 [Anaerofilum sp. BX8]|uniref:Uncharacterized protein n=1 Tax=Anaerofilum hominis TaxID=2763016 RepID=A0A923I846_9FIRM|nr:hypothetical protein [Anaerofilum hominis]MBC5580874.1 hypothetical protein [Anaerofilum hominis]
MPENLTTKQFVDLETGRPVSNPCYIGDVYDADGADAVLRLFGRDKTRDVTGRVGDYRFTDDPVLAENHLWADGSPIDPVAWPELHAYAARLGWPADVQGHFLLPDLRGKFLVGAKSGDVDFAAGVEGGAKTVALTGDNNGPHVHGLSVNAVYAQSSSAVGGIPLGDAGVTRETTSSGKGTPFSILPPYRAVYVQIRAKPDPVVAQEVIADRLSTPRKIGNADFDGSMDITLGRVCDIRKETVTFTSDGGNLSVTFYRIAELCYVSFANILNFTNAPNKILTFAGNVPAQFRPAGVAYCPAAIVNADTSAGTGFFVISGSTVKAACSIASRIEFNGFGVYLLAEGG